MMHDTGLYQIVCLQGDNGELLTQIYAVSEAFVHSLRDTPDELGRMLHMATREMDYALLGACGHVDRHRLWGVDFYNKPLDRHARVHILDGPDAGWCVNLPRDAHTLSTAQPGYGVSVQNEYKIYHTVIGRVAVLQTGGRR